MRRLLEKSANRQSVESGPREHDNTGAVETRGVFQHVPESDSSVVSMHSEADALQGGVKLCMDDVVRHTEDLGISEGVRIKLNLLRHHFGDVFRDDASLISNEKVKYISTEMPSNAGKFHNFFGRRIWIMGNNVRDRDRCAFYMNQVVAHQAEIAGCNGKELEYLVQHHIVSEDGLEFGGRHGFSNGKVMTSEQLNEFMTTTVNGKSSGRILNDHGKAVSRAVISQSLNQKLDGVYTVVLKVN